MGCMNLILNLLLNSKNCCTYKNLKLFVRFRLPKDHFIVIGEYSEIGGRENRTCFSSVWTSDASSRLSPLTYSRVVARTVFTTAVKYKIVKIYFIPFLTLSAFFGNFFEEKYFDFICLLYFSLLRWNLKGRKLHSLQNF